MISKLKQIFKNVFIAILDSLSPNYSCKFNNLRQKLMNRNFFFYYDAIKKLYFVLDDNKRMYFSDKLRGIQTYSYGIKHRAEQLINTYGIEKIKFSDKDIIIDCGANYGDLYAWTKLNNLNINYISFEPSPNEFKCIELNCINQNNNNFALSDTEGYFDFFLKSDSGDSSIIEPSAGFTKKIKVKTTSLSNYISQNKIEKVKLFKVEGEGFEPEILRGANNVLQKIEYIGVDGSPERGKNNETTIEYASEFLISKDFEIVFSNINQKYAKVLFRNKNF